MKKVRLNKMEFPYKYINKIIKKYKNINKYERYPKDKNIKKAKKRILKLLKINYLKKENIVIGNGSDEIISIIISMTKEKNMIGFFKPTFTMYKKYCCYYNKKFKEIKLIKNFKIKNKTKKFKKFKKFFVCYPNNPNGDCFKKKIILEIIKKNKRTLFIIDEAYYPYTKKSLVKYIKKYKNIIIIRTFSKIGLAGLRIGIALSNKKIIKKINKKKSPYNIGCNQINIINKIFKKNLYKIIKLGIKRILICRKIIINFLNKTKFLFFYKTLSNFILIRRKDFKKIKINKNIKIKKLEGKKKNYYRVTVGNKKETFLFLKEIFKYEKRIQFRKKNKRNKNKN